MFTAKSSLPSFYLRSSIDQAINLLTVKTFKRLCIFLFALPKQHLPETEYAANSRSMTWAISLVSIFLLATKITRVKLDQSMADTGETMLRIGHKI